MLGNFGAMRYPLRQEYLISRILGERKREREEEEEENAEIGDAISRGMRKIGRSVRSARRMYKMNLLFGKPISVD